MQHFAEQLVEYLVLNVTQWNAKTMDEKVNNLLEVFDATRNQRFAHEYQMTKIALTKFLKKNPERNSPWERAPCKEIWSDLRAITNALTNGKKQASYYSH